MVQRGVGVRDCREDEGTGYHAMGQLSVRMIPDWSAGPHKACTEADNEGFAWRLKLKTS